MKFTNWEATNNVNPALSHLRLPHKGFSCLSRLERDTIVGHIKSLSLCCNNNITWHTLFIYQLKQSNINCVFIELTFFFAWKMSEFKLCVEVERKDSLKLNLSADGIKGDRDVSVKIYQNDSIKIKTDVKRKKTQMTPYVDGKKGKISLFLCTIFYIQKL